jgi:outer membrane receptor for ferrienterochelin and colicin
VDVANADAVSGAKQIKLLGLAGIYSQIMTDNIPNLRGLSIPFGLEYIPIGWMESISISKGTASVRYGSESITGQINVDYIQPDRGDLLDFNLYGESTTGKIESNLYSAVKLNKKLSTATFFRYQNKLKPDKNKDKNKDGFMDSPSVKQFIFLSRWKYKISKKVVLKFGAKYVKEDRYGGQLSFDKEKPRDVNNGYGIGIKTDRYELFTKGAYFFNDTKTTSLSFFGFFAHHKQESFFGLNDYNATENNFYGNVMFQTNLSKDGKSSLILGTSFVIDNYDKQLSGNILPELKVKNDEQLKDLISLKKESIPGAFIEYTYENKDHLTILLGLRSDFHNMYGTLITPRVHFKYNLTNNTVVRASAGKGFRSPNIIAENIYLLSSSRKLKIKEIPDIEEAWNYGINLSQDLKLFGREMTVNFEFFRTEFMNQLIIDRDQDISSIYVYNLKGKSYSNNFQIEANYELFDRMDMVLAARYNDVKVTINNQFIKKPLSSDFKALINLSYTTNLKKWQFDFTTLFNGKSRIPDISNIPLEYQPEYKEYSPEYMMMNVQITKYFRKWDLYFGCENLTNFKQNNPILAADKPFEKYFDSSLIWGPIAGRKFYLGLRYKIKHNN